MSSGVNKGDSIEAARLIFVADTPHSTCGETNQVASTFTSNQAKVYKGGYYQRYSNDTSDEIVHQSQNGGGIRAERS